MKKIFQFIPGFRSLKPWKISIASIYYFISFIIIFADIQTGVIMFLMPFVLFNIPKLTKKKPITKHIKPNYINVQDEITKTKEDIAQEIQGTSINFCNFNPDLCPIICMQNSFIALDLETTGLSPRFDKIIEIAAIKYKCNNIVDTFSTLINPGILIPKEITLINGITNEMVKDKPRIENCLTDLKEFFGDLPLVVHNSSFDIGFLNANFAKIGHVITNPIIDTLQISRRLFSNLPNHKLDTIKSYLKIDFGAGHRATSDTKVCAQIYLIYCANRISQYTNMNDFEIKCFSIIKEMLINSNRDVKYLRCRYTDTYFDIMAFYRFMRIKSRGRKQYLLSKHDAQEIIKIFPDAKFEEPSKSERDAIRIIINTADDLYKMKDLILKDFDEAITSMEMYRDDIKKAESNIKEYLLS